MSDKYPFLDRWLDSDEYSSAYEKHIDNFLKQFPDENTRNVICKMLNHYIFYTREVTANYFERFANNVWNLIASLNLNPGNYCVTLPIKDDKPHNSDNLCPFFKRFPRFFRKADGITLSNCDYVFVVDDYAGSGKTIKSYVDYVRPFLKQNVVVYALPVFCNDEAITFLTSNNFICNTNIINLFIF